MRSVPPQGSQSRIAARLFPKDTAERYASEARFLEHPHRWAILLGFGWGLVFWAIRMRFDTRDWAIYLVVVISLSSGYGNVYLIHRRHRRSRYWRSTS
jgi:hypothetical protein